MSSLREKEEPKLNCLFDNLTNEPNSDFDLFLVIEVHFCYYNHFLWIRDVKI